MSAEAIGRFERDIPALRVVICGTYRKGFETLREDYGTLGSRYEILSPVSLDFIDRDSTFVRLPSEVNEAMSQIEQRHIAALAEADFVWLHAPDGYTGASAMFELGYARALGLPIFAREPLQEGAFQPHVTTVATPDDICLRQEHHAPGNGLRGLQRYYERAALRRGWASESVQDTMLLLTEEIGELARALRKSAGIQRDQGWEGQDVAEELADVQLYLVHLANISGVELADAVTNKELVNAERAAGQVTVA
ncbi:MazG nucleotide pyrophosphohydrolase domain-containing protein [Mycobacterium sp. 141]|uniref:MazG nucleotide pyrophosphohydrolase domain-containing protein n=1 Tax=Mycobacterium sp. 141 TaxID=1120797 RepID=UPI00035F4A09|nr:MazG nucleotide pyrophosphohydrolase domain-containing protein [Mycobacterium sp. 141]